MAKIINKKTNSKLLPKVVKSTTGPEIVKKTTKVIKPIITEEKPLSVRFINKNLKVSPRKLRLIVNNIKTLDPVTVLSRLKFTNTNAARLLVKCLEDAIASAKNNYKLIPQTLKFKEMRVDEGMKIKRMDKSHGSRFSRGIIMKRHSRLVIVLSGTISG